MRDTELGLHVAMNLGVPHALYVPGGVGVPGPPWWIQGLPPPLSLQALSPAASVLQAERENSIYLLKVGRIGAATAWLIVKIFQSSHVAQ